MLFDKLILISQVSQHPNCVSMTRKKKIRTKWKTVIFVRSCKALLILRCKINPKWKHITEAYSEPCQTSKMERSAKIVSDFSKLTISQNRPS